MGALSLILKHPGDIVPLYRVKCMADQAKKLPKEPNLRFCYHMLNLVSRSFAIVISSCRTSCRTRCASSTSCSARWTPSRTT